MDTKTTITKNDRAFHVTVERDHNDRPVVFVEYVADEETAAAAGLAIYPLAEIVAHASEFLGYEVEVGDCFHYGEGQEGRTEEGWHLDAMAGDEDDAE